MATIEADIERALFDRVASAPGFSANEIAWPNMSFNTGQKYLRVTHTPNRSERMFLRGTDPHRRRGLLQLSVFTPKNAGAPQATERAGLIAAHFPADLALQEGNVRLHVTKAPDLAGAFADDTHWHVPVTVSYECFA